MSKVSSPPAGERDRITLAERLRETIETLEAIVEDRGVLAHLAPEERTRLTRAAALVHNPDVRERRLMVKAVVRQRKDSRVRREEAALAGTGIRSLRRKPVFTTPNVFPPPGFEPRDVVDDDESSQPRDPPSRSQPLEPQHCYVCKDALLGHPPLLRPAVPALRRAQLREAHRARGPERPRGAAHRRAREDRLPGRPQAAARRARTSSSRRGSRATRRRATPPKPDFADWGHRLEIFGLDLRHTPSVEAFCHELLATRTRLDFIVNNACQTVRRPPEFYAHMMAEETAALRAMPARVRRLLGELRGPA